MRVAHTQPKSSAIYWMKCPRTHEDVEEDIVPTVKAPLILSNNAGHHSQNKFFNKYLAFTIIVISIINRDLLN